MDAANSFLQARRGRWAVGALFFINGFMIGSWATQIPQFIKHHGLSEAVFGIIVLAFGLGGMLAMPAAGLMMSRLGSRPVALPLATLAVFGLLLVVLAPNAVLATAALVVFGAVLGGMDVAMNANAVTVERRLRRPIMSSTHGFWSLGGFAGSGIGGLAVQSFGPVAHAAFTAVAAAAILSVAARHIVGADRPEPRPAGSRIAFPSLPTIYVVGLIAMICVVPEATVRNWGALFMEQEAGADIGVAALAFSVFSGAMAVMRFLGDGIRGRFGAVLTLRASCAVTAAGLLVAAVSPWIPLTLLAFAVAGLGSANMIPIAFSAAGNHEGMASSTGMSVATTMSYCGILLSPPLTGLVAEHSGIAPVFVGVAGLLFFATLLASTAHRADFRHA
jgi:predicted MFS family arabinose efflux permease